MFKDERIFFYRKLRLGLYALFGYVYKILVDLHLIAIPKLNKNKTADVIISLTSYGRRVKTNVVYYTIVSLLRQTVQPDRIVLWLSEDEWNNDSIPDRLKNLKKKGVEILYCKDIRSYKKLIPTLKMCSGMTIITVDDDIIYSRDTVEVLVKEHNYYPSDIICLNCSIPIFVNGIPQKYEAWNDVCQSYSDLLIFPVGCGGILYPNGSLHKDVIKEELFLELCSNADDIWFWFCGLRKGTIKRYVLKKGIDYSFDAFYQYLHKGSALSHSNRFENRNDVQFKQLFDFYNVRITEGGLKWK